MPERLPYIVIGAGPAGLTAARKLSEAGEKVIVLEREAAVGGISASRYWNEFIVEFGPHTYHVKRDRIDDIIREHYEGALPDKKRITRMLLRGRYFNYPLQFWQLIQGLNPLLSAKMLGDFLYTSIKSKLFPRSDDSFESWGIKRFGKTLYELCFGQYTRRVWGIDPSRLSVRLASQKLHKLNLKDVLIKLLGGKGQEQATYWEYFLYPEEGMGIIFENMTDRIKAKGGEVWLDSTPLNFRVESDRVVEVTINRDGNMEAIPSAGVISTVPLATLSRFLKSYLPDESFAAGQKLRSRSLVLVNLIISVPRVSDAHWVYLLDPTFRFNRFCEQKNLLLDRKPHLKTLITFELCCEYGGSLWKSSDETLRKMALKDIKDISIIDGRRAGECIVQRVEDAYPIYDLAYERNLEMLLKPLSQIANLYSTGRQGLFLNTDMHDSMEMGLLAAEDMLAGKASALWYARMMAYLNV